MDKETKQLAVIEDKKNEMTGELETIIKIPTSLGAKNMDKIKKVIAEFGFGIMHL